MLLVPLIIFAIVNILGCLERPDLPEGSKVTAKQTPKTPKGEERSREVEGNVSVVDVSGVDVSEACSIKLSSDKRIAKPTAEIMVPSITVGRLNVTIDPRIELLSAVQLLSDYFGITEYDFSYKKDVLRYFSDYKSHEAVKIFKEMSDGGFNYDAPPHAMLHLSDPPLLEIETEYCNYVIHRANGKEKLDEFVNALRNFSLQTNFGDFYSQHLPFYNDSLRNVCSELGEIDVVGELEEYYGMEKRSYTLILAPLFHRGGYGPRIENNDGVDVYCIIGPLKVKNDKPDFGSKQRLRTLLWHEFGHSFINPLTEKHKKEVSEYSDRFSYVKDRIPKAYNNWETYVNELFIRAVVIRLTDIHVGEKAAKHLLEYEKSKGFVQIDEIIEKLREYEENRDKYKNFDDFYPELIRTFASFTG